MAPPENKRSNYTLNNPPEVDQAESVSISNPVDLVDKLKKTPVIGILDDVGFFSQMNWRQGREPMLGDYLTNPFNEIPTSVRLEICKLILKEGNLTANSKLKLSLEGLVTYYEDRSKPTPSEENKKQEKDLEAILGQLVKTDKAISSVEGSGTITDLWSTSKGILSNGVVAAVKTLDNLPPAGKTAVFAGLVFAAWKLGTSPRARDVLWSSVKWGGGIYLANHLVKAFNGKSLTQNIDNWIIAENKPYASYLGLDYAKDEGKRITNAFVESLKIESNMGGKTFKELTANFNPKTRSVSEDLANGVELTGVDKKHTGEVMHNVINQVIKKFGPDSVLYKNNPEIKGYWDLAVQGSLPWRQVVIRLIVLDPQSVKLGVKEKENI